MAVKDLIPTFGRKRLAVQDYDYENPFQLMRREMDRFFDRFGDFGLMPFGRDLEMGFPKIDVRDAEKEVVVEAELPGMDEKDISISLIDDVLRISGEKKQEKEERKGTFYHVERSYGKFNREIPLHCEVDLDKAEAKFKKGVLTIKLPKTPEERQRAKSIPIHTAE